MREAHADKQANNNKIQNSILKPKDLPITHQLETMIKDAFFKYIVECTRESGNLRVWKQKEIKTKAGSGLAKDAAFFGGTFG